MRLDMNTTTPIFAFLLLVMAVVEGTLVLTGCTNAFVIIECPMDDTVQVTDVRVTIADKGSPCIMKPPDKFFWKVPKIYEDLCQANKSCVYKERICEGKNKCAFYADPHLVGDWELPNINSELIISYECKAGDTRKAGLAILIIIALSLTAGGGYLMYTIICKKKDQPASSYAAFNNERRGPSSGTSASTAQPAQVHLSVSGPTGTNSAPTPQSHVTPSSGSVF